MNNIRLTSIVNLRKHKIKLTHDEKIIWDALYFNGPMTDREIAQTIGWYPSNVSARRNGLISKGACVDNGTRKCKVTGNTVTEWKAVAFADLKEPEVINNEAQLTIF